MFCPSCGNEIPDRSGFCLGCGKPIQTSRASTDDAAPWRPARLRRILIGGLATIGLLVVIIVFTNATEDSPRGGGLPFVRPVSKPLLDGQTVVSAGQTRYWTFETSAAAFSSPRVVGSFEASGGMGNDIETAIGEWAECENWINGHRARLLYSSGRVTAGNLDVSIPRPGRYCLAFSNRMSLFSGKTIAGIISLRYF